ncbi:MAG TPA: acyl carrier protein [Dongiaceae bacterium]|nr:acyl carrier protein [Dongiaceae bacterium]
MTETEIRQAILEAIGQIAPEADPTAIRPEDNLREALDIDSFDFLQVLIRLNRRLGVEIPESDYTQLATFSGMIRYLSDKLAAH